MKFILTIGALVVLGVVTKYYLLDNNARSTQHTDDVVSIGGQLVSIYDGISVSVRETSLDLSGRQLSGSLKAEIRQLTMLEELDLSNNNFTGLPAEVGQLAALRVLNLSNNPLTGLPNELGGLQQLELFDLRGTNYAEQDLAAIKNKLPATTVILTE